MELEYVLVHILVSMGGVPNKVSRKELEYVLRANLRPNSTVLIFLKYHEVITKSI